ncbi:MAG: proton-conducting transporter membrane subunit, partial [Acidimicrobiia bacterium]
MIEITTPDVSWIAILPELVLALGAVGVLLVEVQWKPATRVLGAISAITLVIAIFFTFLQWAQAGDALEVGGLDELVAFSGMIVMDGFAVFGRFVLLVMAGLGLLAGWRLVERLNRRGAEAIALVLLATTGFSIMVASNNLVMMFLGLEIGSISLYILAGLTEEKTKADEAAMKYFLLGSFASA